MSSICSSRYDNTEDHHPRAGITVTRLRNGKAFALVGAWSLALEGVWSWGWAVGGGDTLRVGVFFGTYLHFFFGIHFCFGTYLLFLLWDLLGFFLFFGTYLAFFPFGTYLRCLRAESLAYGRNLCLRAEPLLSGGFLLVGVLMHFFSPEFWLLRAFSVLAFFVTYDD